MKLGDPEVFDDSEHQTISERHFPRSTLHCRAAQSALAPCPSIFRVGTRLNPPCAVHSTMNFFTLVICHLCRIPAEVITSSSPRAHCPATSMGERGHKSHAHSFDVSTLASVSVGVTWCRRAGQQQILPPLIFNDLDKPRRQTGTTAALLRHDA